MPWPKGKSFSPEMIAKRTASFKQSGARAKKPMIVDGVERWRCPNCNQWLVVSAFYPSKRTANKLTSECRTCHGRVAIQTRDPEKAKRNRRESMRRQRANNIEKFRERDRLFSRLYRPDPQKARARQLLNNAVRSGKISRPTTCEQCGLEKKITGHHPDYCKPLEVQWLCYECHGNR